MCHNEQPPKAANKLARYFIVLITVMIIVNSFPVRENYLGRILLCLSTTWSCAVLFRGSRLVKISNETRTRYDKGEDDEKESLRKVIDKDNKRLESYGIFFNLALISYIFAFVFQLSISVNFEKLYGFTTIAGISIIYITIEHLQMKARGEYEKISISVFFIGKPVWSICRIINIALGALRFTLLLFSWVDLYVDGIPMPNFIDSLITHADKAVIISIAYESFWKAFRKYRDEKPRLRKDNEEPAQMKE